MNHTQTLVHHRDIQNWVAARRGMPAISRVPTSTGEMRARLALKFGKLRSRPSGLPNIDDGMSPVSWAAWLAELDRQRLALKVSNQKTPDFEFVEREEANSGEPLN
ncbi:MAG: hypothetical protein ACTHOR_11565 [Devosia sp.]|jgi:hypothetical protein